MDTKMGLGIDDNSARTSNSEEKDLNERILFRKKLISTVKEIKDLSEENLKEEEQLKICELENGRLSKTLVDLNAQ